MNAKTKSPLVRTGVCQVLAVVLFLAASRALAVGDTWDPAHALTRAGWSWAVAQEFELAGARLRVQRFSVPVAPAHAARQLNQAGAGRFVRLQLTQSGMLLSGLSQGQHWLAQLQPDRAGTSGLVSSLLPSAVRAVDFDAARFAPAGARQVLRVSSRSPATHGGLTSFDCPGTLAEVATTVSGALRAAHWQAVAQARPTGAHGASSPTRRAVPGATLLADWRSPDGTLLTVHLIARAQTVALTFWYRPGEAS